MMFQAGTKLRSAVCDAQFVVVKAPARYVDLACGGAPLVADGEESPSAQLDDGLATGSQLGKRYADEGVGLELLCTRAGAGTLTCDGVAVAMKDAKPLPASD